MTRSWKGHDWEVWIIDDLRSGLHKLMAVGRIGGVRGLFTQMPPTEMRKLADALEAAAEHLEPTA